MRSFLRWAGSKRQLLSVLEQYWSNSFSRYIEPFAGSSCLFFHLEPRSAILGDLNGELIMTLRAIRLDAVRVIECLRRLPKSRQSYYRIRLIDPGHLGLFEAAARFLYLNSLCFNGLYRTNMSGRFNVPYCPPGHKTVSEELLLQASVVLKAATLVRGDFQATIEAATNGDFVYLDPPYAVSRRRVFAEYGPTPFATSDLQRLDKSLAELDRRKAKFIVSYADCPEARKILANWNIRRVKTKRNIAGFTGDRRISNELLATNLEN